MMSLRPRLMLASVLAFGCSSDGETAPPDAVVVCGDGRIDPPETCDGASCPDSCDDGDACTSDTLTGDAASCTARCSFEPIAGCMAASCGNGSVEPGESCDDGAANNDAWSAAEHCNAACSGAAPHCGDGAVEAAEETCGEPGLPGCGDGRACVDCACVACTPAGDPALAAQLVIGAARELVAVGQHLYAVSPTTGLHILDVSDAALPTQLGMVASSDARDVAVAGNHAYLVEQSAGLKVIDVSDPASPAIVGVHPMGHATGVAVSGSHVYVSGSELEVIDVSNPSSPALVGTLDHNGYDIAIEGSHAFMTSALDQMKVIDIANPAAPAVVATDVTGNGTSDLIVVGGVAYVIVDDRVQIVDVSVPTNPTYLSNYQAPNTVRGVAAAAGHAFVAYGSFPDGMAVLDMSTPSAPVVVDTVGASGASAVGANATHAFLSSYQSGYPALRQIALFDTSDPTNLTLSSTYDAPTDARALSLVGDHLYVADDRGLRTFDVSSRDTPLRRTSRFVSGYAAGIFADTTSIYVVTNSTPNCAFDAYLRTFDATVPADPVPLGAFNFSSGGCGRDVAVTSGHAYVAVDTVRVISLSPPNMPVEVGEITSVSSADGIAVEGSLAYVAAGGLRVFDLSTPAAPAPLGSLVLPGVVHDVAVVGDRAYLAHGADGVHVVDVATPASPTLIGSFDTPGEARSIAVAGSTLLVADGSSVLVLDASDPASVSAVGSYPTTGIASDVASADGYAYVAAGTSGALVLALCP